MVSALPAIAGHHPYQHAVNGNHSDDDNDDSNQALQRNYDNEDGDPAPLEGRVTVKASASSAGEPAAGASRRGQASVVEVVSPVNNPVDSEKQWESLVLLITAIAGLMFSSMAISSSMPVTLTAIAGLTLLEITVLALYYLYCKQT